MYHEIHVLKIRTKSLVDDWQLPDYFNISSLVGPIIKRGVPKADNLKVTIIKKRLINSF